MASKQKCLGVSQNSGPTSEGTDSTAEPDFTDGSETDSLSGNFPCGRLAEEVPLHHNHQSQQASRGNDVRKANKASAKKTEGVAQKKSQNSGGKKGAGAFADFEVPSSNHGATESSPEAFAAAWNVAARSGAWKGEGRKTQSPKVQKEPLPQGQCAPRENLIRQSSSGTTDAAQKPRTEDLPMPKWFTPACENIVAPLPVGIVRKPRVEPSVDQLVQIMQSAIQQGHINTHGQINHGHTSQPALDQELVNALGRILEPAGRPPMSEDLGSRNGGSDRPLKIHTPYADFNASGMNPDLPIKKRVPDWSF